MSDGLEIINSFAFKDCKKIKELVIPDSVTEIKGFALNGCTSLAKLTVPFVGMRADDNEQSGAVFGIIFGYTDLSERDTVEQQFSEKGKNYYYVPSTLTSVTVTSDDVIPYGAFSGCVAIKEFTFGASLTEFSAKVIEGCTGLTQVNYAGSESKWAKITGSGQFRDITTSFN